MKTSLQKGTAFMLASCLLLTALPTVQVTAANPSYISRDNVAVRFLVEGNDIAEDEELHFKLLDSNGQSTVSWTHGKEANASIASPLVVKNISGKSDYSSVYNIDLKKATNDPEFSSVNAAKAKLYDSEGNYKSQRDISVTDNCCSYSIKSGYTSKLSFNYKFIPQRTDYTVPGNTVHLINTQSCENTSTIKLDKHSYKNTGTINKPLVISLNSGDYQCYAGTQNGLGGSDNHKIHVSNTPTYYYKAKIHLADVSPASFTDDGRFILSSEYSALTGLETATLGVQDYIINGQVEKFEAQIAFASGSLIQSPSIDENGDIEVYLLKDTSNAYIYTSFERSYGDNHGTGGGKFLTYTHYRTKEIAITSDVFDTSKGLVINNIPAGKYTLVQTATSPKRHSIKSMPITIKSTLDLQDFIIKLPDLNAHIPGEPQVTLVSAATCTQPGSMRTVIKCTDCGETISDTTSPISPLGHSWSENTRIELPPEDITSDLFNNAENADELCFGQLSESSKVYISHCARNCSAYRLYVEEAPIDEPSIEDIIEGEDIDNNEDKLSPFSVLQLKLTAKKNKSGKYINTITWKKVKGVDGYIIYASKCGHKLKKVTTVGATKTKWSQKNCKKGVYYKYLVAAYKGDKIIATSKTVHGVFGSKKYTNPTGIKGVKKSLTLKVGKASTIKAKVLVKEKKKRVQKHVAILRYESSNPKVARVSKKGKIKAIKKGKATIYVYTQNGICKKIKVTVK